IEIGTVRITVNRTAPTIIDTPAPDVSIAESMSRTDTDSTGPTEATIVDQDLRNRTVVDQAKVDEPGPVGPETMFAGDEVLHPILDRALALVDVLARILFELRPHAPSTVSESPGLAAARDAHALAAYLLDGERQQTVDEALSLAAEALASRRPGAGIASERDPIEPKRS
ncbi:MAG TPA: hypothetical protein VHU90_05945, partial [Galbitalea sp.]|nr:hypothetical protein [Galbitalea sp.]